MRRVLQRLSFRRAYWRVLLLLLSWTCQPGLVVLVESSRGSRSSSVTFVHRTLRPLSTKKRTRKADVRVERRSKPFDTAADGSIDTASSSTSVSQNNQRSRGKRRLVPPHVLDDLSSANIQFPYTCQLLDDNEPKKPLFWKPGQHKQQESINNNVKKKNSNPVTMTVRLLQGDDIQTVTDMCCQEYGVGEAALGMSKTASTAIRKVDFQALNRLLNQVVEESMLRAYVDWTMRLKVAAAAASSRSSSSSNNHARTQPPPNDHAILLLTLSNNKNGESSYNTKKHHHRSSQRETVVGIVEVSRQPPIPEHNPSAFPIPLFFKKMYCWWWSISRQRQQQKRQQALLSSTTKGSKRRRTTSSKMMQPEGWITNVLVAPEFRGQGWSKVLVHACEGVARSWKVPAIHLHCDANGVSGRVPQALYMSMGYTYRDEGNIDDDDNEYHWLRLAAESAEAASPSTSTSPTDDDSTSQPAICSSSVYVIEGVPLLYLKKDL